MLMFLCSVALSVSAPPFERLIDEGRSREFEKERRTREKEREGEKFKI
jgi:hypothetical protein